MFKESSEGQTHFCEGCETEARFEAHIPVEHTCGKTPSKDTREGWENKFDKKFLCHHDPGQIICEGDHLRTDSPDIVSEIKEFICKQVTLARSEGITEEAINCHDHCEKARKEERERCKEIIVQYFKGLILIPDPRSTGESLLKSLDQQ